MTNENCTICMEKITDSSITTPCKHTYHTDCIKGVQTPNCPVCRKNIFWFLIKKNILKRKEIIKREKTRKKEIMIDEYNTYVEATDINNETVLDFLEKAYNSYIIKLPNSIYNFVVLYSKLIKNAADLFCQISHIMHNNNKPGVFYYKFMDATDIVGNLASRSDKSLVRWLPLQEFKKNKDLNKHALEHYNDIEDRSKEFCAIIEMDLEEMESAAYYVLIANNKVGQRPRHMDILRSLRLGEPINAHPEDKDYLEPNRELQWAKKFLRKLGVKKIIRCNSGVAT
jgi:hypothetical protein